MQAGRTRRLLKKSYIWRLNNHLIINRMKTKEESSKAVQAAAGDRQTEANVSQPKRYNKLGEWLHSPDRKPLLRIIDMKAVLK
ncbi:hypothetical protein Barb6XT_01329 [Bacteroidales bacterium Barb6XT]|nr:hypothetical protein Barb6XT_01329 [Bacteroidales bacterium Barb6XT]